MIMEVELAELPKLIETNIDIKKITLVKTNINKENKIGNWNRNYKTENFKIIIITNIDKDQY